MLGFSCPGLAGSDPGEQTYTPLTKPCFGGIPHTKQRRIGRDVSSAAIFLKQKEEDWQQMLAQGQSSSPKNKERKKKQK